MSRSGYSDDCDMDWRWIMWRGRVASAIRGKRGQKLLRELVEALDAMPEKKLIAHELRNSEGVCALGAVGVRRGVALEAIDPEDSSAVAAAFDVANALVREIEFVNDEEYFGPSEETPESRWRRVRDWAARQIKAEEPTA